MKKETKEKINNFFEKIDKVCNSIFMPFLCIMLLSLAVKLLNGTCLGVVLSYITLVVFVLWLGFVVYSCVRSVIDTKVVWPLIFSIVLIIISIILSLVNETDSSNTCFIIGGIFFELDLIYLIISNVNKGQGKITPILVLSLLFVVIGYYLIYACCYNDEKFFNSLIAVFSAIIGGSLTLGGVAWTIKWNKTINIGKRRKEIHPFIYKIDVISEQGERIKEGPVFGEKNEKDGLFFGSLKNSDKIEFIVKSVTICGIEYKCSLNELIKKGEEFSLFVYSKTKPENNSFILTLEDVDGNEINYQIIYEEESVYKISKITELNNSL